jgi:GH25 family lysozyme M1 (1,4-beta-N-acetylmuramidase)
MDKVLGIDLNDYRKGVPLRQAKQQGVRFVINKATEGTESGWNLVHDTLEIYRADAKLLGLPFGAYLYWRFQFDAVEQAEFYCKHLGKVQFRPIVDCERTNNRGSGGGPIVSTQANINHLRVVCEKIFEITGVKPMIYTNWATWKELFGNSTWFADNGYELWVASYGWWRTSPLMPIGFAAWRLWQWTSAYKIEGYYRGVDGNWFNGNDAAFEAYIAQIAKLWNPEPEPEPEPPIEWTYQLALLMPDVSALRIRSGPSTGYGVVGHITQDHPLVEVIEKKVVNASTEWFRIGYKQWAAAKYNGRKYLEVQ